MGMWLMPMVNMLVVGGVGGSGVVGVGGLLWCVLLTQASAAKGSAGGVWAGRVES